MKTTFAIILLSLVTQLGCAASHQGSAKSASKAASAEHFVHLAQQAASVGDATRAEQYLNLALKGGAESARVTPLLVSIYIQAERYRDAVQYLETYVRKHPDDSSARFVLGGLYWGVGHGARARQQFEAVVAQQPSHAASRFALATLLRDELGDSRAADQHFRAYLELEPGGCHADEARHSLLTHLEPGGVQ